MWIAYVRRIIQKASICNTSGAKMQMVLGAVQHSTSNSVVLTLIVSKEIRYESCISLIKKRVVGKK